MKTCIKCGNESSLEDFYKSHLGYYQSECRLCTRKRSNEFSKSNPTKVRDYKKAYRERNKNTVRLKSVQCLEGMVARSKKKGFDRPEFTSAEIAQIMEGGVCSKTGIPFEFDQSKYPRSPWTPVPDRIDPSKGYTRENVQWVCHMYNSMKQDYSEEEVQIFLEALWARGLDSSDRDAEGDF